MNVETYKRELSRCVRCGACKAVCPTYLKLRDESMSPRGRLALIGAVENIELNPTKLLSHKLYSCILCGACSTSCSPKIPIYELLRYSRKIMAEKTFRVSIIEKFTKLMPSITDIPLTQKIAKRDVIKRIEKQKLFFKNREKIGSVLVFMGCLVNYVYPH
ncbi:MAG: (Fe-S)-binding protein, partial [Nitrospirae bacterium]